MVALEQSQARDRVRWWWGSLTPSPSPWLALALALTFYFRWARILGLRLAVCTLLIRTDGACLLACLLYY